MPQPSHRHRLPSGLLMLLLLAAVSLAAGLGLREPSPPDEPRFVLAARHMVETGDWLVPRRGSEFYAEKPPVFMWIHATTYSVVRDWRVAFLLPSLLAALGTLWLVWDLASRLWGRRIAVYAPAALWICLQFGLQAKRGQIDMVLVFMTTLALWGIARHLLRGPAWGALWLGAFAAGVGTVTKGVGFLPLLLLVPWAIAYRRMPTLRDGTGTQTGHWALMAVAFIAGTGVWLGPLLFQLMRDGDPALHAYAQELLFKQTGQRYANAWHHVQPAWYYLQVIFTLWLPAAFLLPWLLPAWGRRLRRGDARQLLLLGWSLLVLLFFSASPGKREVYIFPALPALCIAAAPLLPGLLRRRGVQLTLFAYLLVMGIAVTAMSATGLMGVSDWALKQAQTRAIDESTIRLFLWWLLALGITGVALAIWGRLRKSAIALVLFTGAIWFVYGLGLAPALDASSSAKSLMRDVGIRIGPNAELGILAWREQNLLQADRPVVDFGFKRPWDLQWRAATTWLTADPGNRWLFVLDEALSPCVQRGDVVAIGQSNRRNWLLVPGTAITPDCVTPSFNEQQSGQD